jgi:hypothetical protein
MKRNPLFSSRQIAKPRYDCNWALPEQYFYSMCGRYRLSRIEQIVERYFDVGARGRLDVPLQHRS